MFETFEQFKESPYVLAGKARKVWVQEENRIIAYSGQAYYSGTTSCPNKCPFCRNKEIGFKSKDYEEGAILEALERIQKKVGRIVFGGGEPLLYINKVLTACIQDHMKFGELDRIMVTSGNRKLWYTAMENASKENDNELPIWNMLDHIILSRHHYRDDVNNAIFGKETIGQRDIEDLPLWLAKRLVLSCTCGKGAIDSVDEIIRYINWSMGLGLRKVMFNNLQEAVTVPEMFRKYEIDSELIFDKAMLKLQQLGFNYQKKIAFSGGYEIQALEGFGTKVEFKRYHNDAKQTRQTWRECDYRIFDVSIEPDGTLWEDSI